MKNTIKSIVVLIAVFGAVAVNAADIEDIMTSVMKGETSLYNRVAKGKGTDADAKRLATTLKGMEGTKDQAAWERKVTALVKAAESVGSGNRQGLMALQNAGNCKACHSGHKPD
jgi:alkylated DNA nucleotide flippase Atl1